MGVTSNQKVSAGRKVYLFVGRARRNEAACRVSSRDEPRSNGSACRPRGSRRDYQLTAPAATKAHRRGKLCQELRAFHGVRLDAIQRALVLRSEERRVVKECRSRWSPYH